MPISGDKVLVSGIYRVIHPAHRRDQPKAFVVGQNFPSCRRCENCEYVLLKAAPGIAEDPDLRSGKMRRSQTLRKPRKRVSS